MVRGRCLKETNFSFWFPKFLFICPRICQVDIALSKIFYCKLSSQERSEGKVKGKTKIEKCKIKGRWEDRREKVD